MSFIPSQATSTTPALGTNMVPAHLTCIICTGWYMKPRELSCGHTACYVCIKELFYTSHGRERCPVCRRVQTSDPTHIYTLDLQVKSAIQSLTDVQAGRNFEIQLQADEEIFDTDELNQLGIIDQPWRNSARPEVDLMNIGGMPGGDYGDRDVDDEDAGGEIYNEEMEDGYQDVDSEPDDGKAESDVMMEDDAALDEDFKDGNRESREAGGENSEDSRSRYTA